MTSPDDRPDRMREPVRPAGLTERFLLSIGREIASNELTPDVLARSVAGVLPVAGAGLSLLIGGLRLPLGASGEATRRAEELETALGEGPCLDAADTQRLAAVSHAALETRWPVYAVKLREHTPFRSVVAAPLHAPGGGVIAALDLYGSHPDVGTQVDLHEVEVIARSTAALLTVCLDEIVDIEAPESGPEWYRRATERRHDVWLAVGMVMSSRDASAQDALSLLRGHAYGRDCTLDDVAALLITGRLPLSMLHG